MLFIRSKRRVRVFACASLLICLTLHAVGLAHAATADTLFPEYPCIQRNIRFWEAIYSKYTTNHGVLHDSDDLGRIYAVIPLLDRQAQDATRINNERIEQGKARIRDILQQLAIGQPPTTAEAQRIAGLFPNKQSGTFHMAMDNIRLQLGQKDRFLEGVIRSGKFLPAFRKILASHHLPLELAYLPHVESSFNPKAYSKAGAAGLWQLTRATGSDYLTINAVIDERYDPYVATDAAARLLKGNYAALQSWPLALTAYNYGRAGMIRAVKDKGDYEAIFRSYDQGYFKFAARNFYAEFLAAMHVAKSLEDNPAIPMEHPENTQSIRPQTAISSEQSHRHNPALQQSITKNDAVASSGYLHRTPAVSRSAQHGKSVDKQIALKSNGQRGVEYIVQQGDTVTSIARKFRISAKIVLTANNQRSIVHSGQKLRIPQNNANM